MNKPAQYTEEELLAGCRANDRFYQERFYRRFAPGMLRMVHRHTRDQELALDIVNRGLLKVFQKIDRYEGRGSLEGWVRRIVFRAMADHFRSRKQPVRFLELQDFDQPLPEQVLQRLYVEDLLDLTDRLPPATREVFLLFAVEGYTHEEIGARLGISSGTSKWHLSEARKKLKALILQNQQYAV